jgi:hypothetical protein
MRSAKKHAGAQKIATTRLRELQGSRSTPLILANAYHILTTF